MTESRQTLTVPKGQLKSKLFEALSAAFPDGEVTVKDHPPGDPKLAGRRIVTAQVGCRVLFKKIVADKEESYAVAGMLPANAPESEIEGLVARLEDDKRRTEIVLTPGRAF